MTKYFFDLQNGDGFTEDRDGRDLPNEANAYKEVATILMDVASDEINGFDPFDAEVTVRDERQAVLFRGSLAFRLDR